MMLSDANESIDTEAFIQCIVEQVYDKHNMIWLFPYHILHKPSNQSSWGDTIDVSG